MEKQIFTFDDLKHLDDQNIMLYALPIVVLSFAAEWFNNLYHNRNWYSKKDLLANLSIGAVSLILGGLIKIWLFAIALVIYNAVPWSLPRSWWGFVACFILIDFFRYWAHRIAHEQRFWWATHVTHHSSEEMNFSVSFRTGWTNSLKFIFFLPVPLLGIDPFTFFICHQLAVLYQFFVHTELIKKLPKPVEYILVTPSHHRVHHGSNAAYLDKNYGSTFIIWDRLFGTFVPEKDKPVYGLTKPVKSYNPVYLVFHEWVALWHDLKYARSVKEAFKILFKPPGTIVTDRQVQELMEQPQEELEIKVLN